jgi:predicted nucleic-acid-binding Zn-ribbon protein
VSQQTTPCPNCEGTTLYRAEGIGAGGGYSPDFLKGAKFDVVVCRTCGLTRWYARPEARQRLGDSKKWKRV